MGRKDKKSWRKGDKQFVERVSTICNVEESVVEEVLMATVYTLFTDLVYFNHAVFPYLGNINYKKAFRPDVNKIRKENITIYIKSFPLIKDSIRDFLNGKIPRFEKHLKEKFRKLTGLYGEE